MKRVSKLGQPFPKPGQPDYTELLNKGSYDFFYGASKEIDVKRFLIQKNQELEETFERLKQDAQLAQQETTSNISSIRNFINEVEDETLRKKLLTQLNGLEENAQKNETIERDRENVLLERQKMEILAEGMERKAKTWMQYIDRFLERESMAIMIGGILLIIIAIVIIRAMDNDPRAREIIYNAFLILVGFFFAQKVTSSRNSGES